MKSNVLDDIPENPSYFDKLFERLSNNNQQRPMTGKARTITKLNIEDINNNNIKLELKKYKDQASEVRGRENFNKYNINVVKFSNILSNNPNNDLYTYSWTSKSFPVKIHSKIVCMYDKINKMIQRKNMKKNTEPKYNKTNCYTSERENTINKYPYSLKEEDISDNFCTPLKRPYTANQLKSVNNMNTNSHIFNRPKSCTFKWDRNGYPQKDKLNVNYYYMSDMVMIKKKNEENRKNQYINLTNNCLMYFSPMNCFNKMAGKYYSCSNNSHVTHKRKKKFEILNNLYLDSDYHSQISSEITDSFPSKSASNKKLINSNKNELYY